MNAVMPWVLGALFLLLIVCFVLLAWNDLQWQKELDEVKKHWEES